jgi:hypothetical protein
MVRGVRSGDSTARLCLILGMAARAEGPRTWGVAARP